MCTVFTTTICCIDHIPVIHPVFFAGGISVGHRIFGDYNRGIAQFHASRRCAQFIAIPYLFEGGCITGICIFVEQVQQEEGWHIPVERAAISNVALHTRQIIVFHYKHKVTIVSTPGVAVGIQRCIYPVIEDQVFHIVHSPHHFLVLQVAHAPKVGILPVSYNRNC